MTNEKSREPAAHGGRGSPTKETSDAESWMLLSASSISTCLSKRHLILPLNRRPFVSMTSGRSRFP